ncbi:Organic radical activating enzyme [Ekhidna lutea]|uniref:7-carboxy-7-deazaguanine synthase n=1 Tax=Ekhidna lutea TaxID=447679 RepID=A0A239KAL0_EKHLU|nr:7-carboxy-7-deazaguanine synthase QueE [Ekhidna lutea]SNT14693.1 Organic radical activating enzyme [Ekhidna lutea]
MSSITDPEYLPVMESFYTIQGEGFFSGTPAYFIRLGGCDVGCVWCDVKESWDASQFDWFSIDQIVSAAKESGAHLVVVTGGEPLMYDLTLLTESLEKAGLQTNIETSGAYPLSGRWDWICFSPKKFKAPLEEFYSKSHELKVVAFNKSDFKWAEGHGDKMHSDSQLFLQPEWSKEKEMTPLIVDFVKQNPKWKISLQTHKYMDIP